MKRMTWIVSLLMIAGLTAGCGSEEQSWDFQDGLVIDDMSAGEDGVVDGENGGPADEGAGGPTLADFDRPDYVEPSVAPFACERELAELTVPSVVEGRLRSGRGEIDELPCTDANGHERSYRLVIDEPTDVRIWTDHENTEFSPVFLLQAGCGEETTDLYCSSPLYPHPAGASASIQARLQRGVYTLTVDERTNLGYGEGGRFKVFVEEMEIVTNGVCEGAAELTPGDLPVVTEPGAGGDGSLAGCFATGGPSQFWTVRMPARSGARFRAEYLDPDVAPGRDQGPWTRVRQACTEFCEGPARAGSVSIANTSNEAVDYVVSVTETRDEPFRVWIEGFTPLAENSSCDSAQLIESEEWANVNPMAGSEQAPLCGGDPVRQLYYQVDVPPNHRLLTRPGNVAVVAYESCEERTCLLDAVNETNASKTYILASGTRSEEPFSFAPRVVELAENSSCQTATPLGLGEPTWGYADRGGATRGTCELIFAEGYSHWYTATIPAGETYELRVERFEGPNLNVEVLDGGCDGSCSENWDAYFNGANDPVVPIVNDGPDARQVHVVITPDGQSLSVRDAYFTVELVEAR